MNDAEKYEYTMLDEDLPLTVTEIPEWGDMKKNKEAFKYIKSYSPYDNVKKQNYPNMLITGGITDPRVTYWEMTKWIAKLIFYSELGHIRACFLEVFLNIHIFFTP